MGVAVIVFFFAITVGLLFLFGVLFLITRFRRTASSSRGIMTPPPATYSDGNNAPYGFIDDHDDDDLVTVAAFDSLTDEEPSNVVHAEASAEGFIAVETGTAQSVSYEASSYESSSYESSSSSYESSSYESSSSSYESSSYDSGSSSDSGGSSD